MKRKATLTPELFRRIFPVLDETPIVDEDAPGFVACPWWIARHNKRMQFVVPYPRLKRGALLQKIREMSSKEHLDLVEDETLRIETVDSTGLGLGADADGPLKPGEEFDFGQRVYRADGFQVIIQGLFAPLFEGLTIVGSGSLEPVLGLDEHGNFVCAVMPMRPPARVPGEALPPRTEGGPQ